MSKYRRPRGRTFDIRLHTENPPWFNELGSRVTGRQREGIRYEAAAIIEFCTRYEGFLPKPWISYRDATLREYWCQPDGLILNPRKGLIVTVEIKYQHTPDAYEQLFQIYGPLVKSLFPTWRVEGVEVVQWFDPAVLCPEQPELCQFPHDPRAGKFNVHIWRA